MDKHLKTQIQSIQDLLNLDRHFLSSYIFRGHSSVDWQLTSSIEREVIKHQLHTYTKKYDVEERWMIDSFKRTYHLYENSKVIEDDFFEWLALMQHYGAKTRLLDFTRSIFIALFFSIVESNEDACVWAINVHQIRDNLVKNNHIKYEQGVLLKDEVNLQHIDFANSCLDRNWAGKYPQTIIPLEPKLMSHRLFRQQGLFLMPTDPNISFTKNLCGSLEIVDLELKDINIQDLIKISDENHFDSGIEIIKFIIPKRQLKEINELILKMNLTYESLFPGVDGLAKSIVQKHMR